MSNGKRGRKPKYTFTLILDNINARDIYKKYHNSIKSFEQPIPTIIEYNTNPILQTTATNSTQVENMLPNTNVNTFLDVKDNNFISMIDHINYGCLPDRTDIHCFHDHAQFDSSPIGLPIKYVKQKNDKIQPNPQVETGINDHFLTFGIFCSFSCCLAYLDEHENEFLFRNSKGLLYSLYYKLYKKELKIKAAPHWECLKEYGGNLTIDEFRSSFCSCKYVITQNIKRPFMVAVGKYVNATPF